MDNPSNVIVTTSSQLEGYRVVKTLDVITAMCVFGMNIFRDMFAGIRDIFCGPCLLTHPLH